MALPPDPRGLSLWFPGGQHAAAQEKATRYFSPPSHKSGDALGSCLHVALSSSPAKRRHYITARRGRTTTKQILYLTWGTLQPVRKDYWNYFLLSKVLGFYCRVTPDFESSAIHKELTQQYTRSNALRNKVAHQLSAISKAVFEAANGMSVSRFIDEQDVFFVDLMKGTSIVRKTLESYAHMDKTLMELLNEVGSL